jgi:hypothetical protein
MMVQKKYLFTTFGENSATFTQSGETSASVTKSGGTPCRVVKLAPLSPKVVKLELAGLAYGRYPRSEPCPPGEEVWRSIMSHIGLRLTVFR